jgi:hypothetical protein
MSTPEESVRTAEGFVFLCLSEMILSGEMLAGSSIG